jgi:F0F1-type ATP synthase epsilon subunit
VSSESVTILTERAENLATADRDALKARADAATGSEADFLNAVLAALQ